MPALKRRKDFTYATQRKRVKRTSIISCGIIISLTISLMVTMCRESQHLSDRADSAPKLAIDLVNSDQFFDIISKANTITLTAFALNPRSRSVQELASAAGRGAKVSVLLSSGFGPYTIENAETVSKLRERGVIVTFASRPMHLKSAIIDGQVYLSDRNWSSNTNMAIIIHDRISEDRELIESAAFGVSGNNDHIWTEKIQALQAEADVMARFRSHLLKISSEAFTADNSVYNQLIDCATKGEPIELIVSPSEYHEVPKEREAILRLQRLGVAVRLLDSDEKYAVTDNAIWMGSANATSGAEHQMDWGLVDQDRTVAQNLSSQFDLEWEKAFPLPNNY